MINSAIRELTPRNVSQERAKKQNSFPSCDHCLREIRDKFQVSCTKCGPLKTFHKKCTSGKSHGKGWETIPWLCNGCCALPSSDLQPMVDRSCRHRPLVDYVESSEDEHDNDSDQNQVTVNLNLNPSRTTQATNNLNQNPVAMTTQATNNLNQVPVTTQVTNNLNQTSPLTTQVTNNLNQNPLTTQVNLNQETVNQLLKDAKINF